MTVTGRRWGRWSSDMPPRAWYRVVHARLRPSILFSLSTWSSGTPLFLPLSFPFILLVPLPLVIVLLFWEILWYSFPPLMNAFRSPPLVVPVLCLLTFPSFPTYTFPHALGNWWLVGLQAMTGFSWLPPLCYWNFHLYSWRTPFLVVYFLRFWNRNSTKKTSCSGMLWRALN